jgi:hypothetical protein
MIHCIHLIESIKREGFARTIYLGVVAVEQWRWWRRRPTYMVVVHRRRPASTAVEETSRVERA